MADKTVTYRLAADISGFQARMAQASASVKKFANDATSATKEGGKFRAGLQTFGSAAGKVGLVAAAGLGAAVAVAANFDQAMSKVQAATGESAANMDKLREAAIQAGAKTAFSASEAADGIEQLAKAGVSTADILGGGLNGALDLAAAGSIGVGEAAETAATAMTQFGLSGQQVPHVADLLAAAAGKAQGEVSDFGMALKQSGLVAAQMGVSLEETTGTLAAFASAGLLGSDAGTSFKTMLLRLANPSSEAADLMDQLGIAAYDAQGNFVGIEALAGQLKQAFEGQSQATRDAALATIFGSDAIRGANVLYNQGAKGIADWTNKVDDTGFAAETAATKLDNLKGDLEAFKGSLETALIGTGEGAQGPLRNLVQSLTDVVNAYNQLPGAAKNAVGGLLAVTAITGGALWFGSKVVRGVADTREALDGLGISGERAGRALRGLSIAAGVVGGVIALDQAIDGLLRSMRDTAPATQEMTSRLLDLASAKADDLGNGFKNLGDDLDFFVRNKPDDKWVSWIPNITGLLPGENAGEQMDRLTDSFQSLDSALANIAQSGSAEQAKAAFDALVKSQGLTATQTKALAAQLPQYGEALKGLENETRLTGESAKSGAAGFGKLGSSMQSAASKGRSLKEVLAEIAGFLDKRGALRNYQAAIDDFTKTIRRNGNTMDINTAKGRENQAALDEIASSALQVADKLKGVNKIRFMRQAIGEIRNVANQMHLPQSETDKLIAKLRTANSTNVHPNVNVNTGGAIAQLSALQTRINALHDKTIIVRVNTVHSGGGYDPTSREGAVGRASGGPVYGPGTSTSDSIPARLSNGEYVVRAAAVQRYGTDFLHAVNAMRFAQGGYTGGPNVTVNPNVAATVVLSDAQFQRLEAAVERGGFRGTAAGMSGREKAALAGRRT